MATRLQGVSARHLGSVPGHGLWGHLVFSAALHLPSQGPSLLDQPPGQAPAGAESEGQADPRWKEKAWGLTACPACLLRIFIIWAISSWFRRGPAPQDQAGPGGAPRVASRNLFPKDTLMVTTGWEARPGRGAGGGRCGGVTWAVGADAVPGHCQVCERGPGLRDSRCIFSP